jgi:hypothetical protein
MLISLWLNFSGFRPLNLTSFVWLRMNGSQLIASLEYSDFLIVGVFVLILVFLFNRKIRESESWRATVTPLASIIHTLDISRQWPCWFWFWSDMPWAV